MTTRQQILEILNTEGAATIEQIAAAFKKRSGKVVSSVTIRYHLNVLLEEGRVIGPQTVHRASRGRPQHLFSAAAPEKSRGNAAEVLNHVFSVLRLQPDVAAMVLDHAAASMTAELDLAAHETLEQRLSLLSNFLNSRGYDASVEQVDRGFILHTLSCPYHDLPEREAAMCGLDMRMIEGIIGRPVQRLTRLADGDQTCAYFIANIEEEF